MPSVGVSDSVSFRAPAGGQKSIWIHTVSVGESIAAAPLVRKLMASCPDHQIVVTTMTPNRVRAG